MNQNSSLTPISINTPQTKLMDSKMTNQTHMTTISQISSLRLPDNYSANIGGIKLPPKTKFGKLSRHRFSRIHADNKYQFPCLAVEDKDNGESYVVAPHIQPYLGKNVVQKIIRLSVDSTGLPKLIFQPIVEQGSRQNDWHSTLNRAIILAEESWVRVEVNMDAGQYTIIESQDDLGAPQWPDQTMDELVQEVFGNNIIDTSEHPYIRQIQGRI